MAYLDIIKELERELSGEGKPTPERDTHCEISELSEKSSLCSVEPAESAPDPVWDPPLGRRNDEGQTVMTIEDLPELAHRLRLSGWRVTRRGNELICTSRGVWKVQ